MVIRSLRSTGALKLQSLRVFVLLAGAVLWGLGICGRLYYLQIQMHDELAARADGQHSSVIDIQGKRGTIYARGGQELATSIDLRSIYAHPPRIADPVAAAGVRAPALGMSVDTVHSRLTRDVNFVYLKRKAKPQEVDAAITAARGAGLGVEAVDAHDEARRYYPHRTLAAHLLGYVSLDNLGQAGVELSYDQVIQGKKGQLNTLRDGVQRLIAAQGAANRPERGHDVRLTLDWGLQYAAEEALQRAVTEHRGQGGSIVALDVRSGEVLAMASYPTFNPNVRDYALLNNSMNHAVQAVFEPGSAFKVITASAALQERVVDENELIDCQGGRMRIAGHTYKDWRFGFGIMPFREVLMNSSNVGTIKVCLRMPPETYYGWIREFGFGTRTEIDLPGEGTGLLREPGIWSALSQPSMAFGQEISATPLQLSTAIAAIANGGTLMRPYVVRELTGPDGATTQVNEPLARRRVLDSEVARRVALMMENVVAEGTGTPARIPGYRVAGKTSTAQKFDPATRTYSKYVAGFVGFLPEPRRSQTANQRHRKQEFQHDSTS